MKARVGQVKPRNFHAGRCNFSNDNGIMALQWRRDRGADEAAAAPSIGLARGLLTGGNWWVTGP